MQRLIYIIISVCLFGVVGGVVSACGGFFCTTAPIDQSAERIIFTINNDETISAIVGINYEGSAEEFSWVVPVPSPPELDVAPTESLNILQNATNPIINAPFNYCDGINWSYGGFGGGGGGYLEQGNVGPYDYAIIGSENPRELIDWLRDNGYQVTEDMEPIIAEYVIEGMYFLAMKLSNDAEVGDIQPVKMTYISSKPMVPLRLTAVAALDDMPVLIWIFADQPYSPENWVHAQVDFASFRTRSQMIDPWGGNDATGDYVNDRDRIQEEYDGRAFITEYAMPSLNLIEVNESVPQDDYLMELINSYPFVTRLRAQLSPEQMTIDPILAPDARQNHMPRTVELADYVDPLHYWGCSNREIDTSEQIERLPNVALLPDNVLFRYPADWVQSNITYRDVPLEAYAQQTITPADLDAFFDGQSDFPIMLRLISAPPIPRFELHYRAVFGFGDDYRLPDDLLFAYYPYNRLFTNDDIAEVLFVLLTTKEEGRENWELYSAIRNYLTSYEYNAHPRLRNTLALSDQNEDMFGAGRIPPIKLGFPEGWTEFLQEDDSIIIVPDDGRSLRVELRQSTAFQNLLIPGGDVANDGLIDQFNLSDETIAQMQEYNQRNCHLFPVTGYETDERVGFFRVINGWLVTVSGLPDEFEAERELMGWIAESVTNPYGCMRG